MIRLLYWIMVVVEIVLLLGTLLLFIITDSRTIHIVAEDILKEYGIEYKNISGNLFTGIEILALDYNGTRLLDSATIHWNPLSLTDNKFNISELDLEGLEIEGLLMLLSALPPSDDEDKLDILFDYDLEKVSITANPFLYHGVTVKNLHLGMVDLSIARDLEIESDLINFSFDSNLVDVELRGEMANREIHLEKLNLKDINIRVITSLVKSINKNIHENRVEKKSTPLPINNIKIDKAFVSLEEITYGPITLEKTELNIESITVDPQNSFSVDAKRAVLVGDTSFADTKQIGYIKDSSLYAKGNVVTRNHLFERYSLPLNRQGLRKLSAKLKVNHKGLWVDIEHRNLNKLLVLNNSFNVDLKRAKHSLRYIYLEKNITITSKAKAMMSYSDDSDVSSLVIVDIAKNGYTTYQGEVDVKKIKNIPDDVTKALLENLKATYKGDSKKLLVKADSKQIEGSFLTEGYKDASLHLESKQSIPLVNLLPSLPKELKTSMGDIQSDSFISFHDNRKTKINVDVDSDVINLKSSMGIVKPFTIEFVGTLPKDSKISKIDKRIKLENIAELKGKVVLDKDEITHISVKNEDLKLSCDYNAKQNRLNNGLITTANEAINFEGSFSKVVYLSSSIKDMNSLSKTVLKYYDIPLHEMDGKATVEVKINADTSVNVVAKSKNIRYLNLQGDVDTTVYVDTNRKVNIEFKSKMLAYVGNDEPIKFHALSGKLFWLDGQIEVDRYSFKYYNDYISHFFSNQKSYLFYQDGILFGKKLWLNDQSIVVGEYNIEKMQGDFTIDSKRFGFKNSDFDLLSKLALTLKIDKERLSIGGSIYPLGNTITYEAFGAGITDDSDIVIVQELRAKEKSALNNIKTNITIENEKPLHYITDDINIEFTNDIAILKDYNREFRIFGVTTINKGYIKQEDKQFFFDESHIYFSGNPKRPLLEIKANYHKEQYDIQIFISGTADDPIINFNSNPYLSQKEILSLILFDATGANAGSGTEAYALLGGTFAKELMKSLGISVDHLLLGQGIDERLSLEVGQKISDNITVIYQHNNGNNGVKVRVDHSDNFETDIIIQSPNGSSIEFLYKQDE